MRKKTTMAALTLAFIASAYMTGRADSQFNSQGKIVFTNGTESTDDDVIFDAKDFERLADVCR